jgi:hypothetical protein
VQKKLDDQYSIRMNAVKGEEIGSMERTFKMTGHHMIPLFPLGVVLLPQMELPLHIFEERQQFLEITSPRQRLTKCIAILKTVIQRMKNTRKIIKIIGGNGDVKGLISER